MLVAFLDARRINQFSGGTVIAPWDLESGHDLEEWTEAADMLSELPSIRARKKAQQQVFEKARREHKHYAPMHYRRH